MALRRRPRTRRPDFASEERWQPADHKLRRAGCPRPREFVAGVLNLLLIYVPTGNTRLCAADANEDDSGAAKPLATTPPT
jgi:hypothetical protein